MTRITCWACNGTGDKRIAGYYKLFKCQRCRGYGVIARTPLNVFYAFLKLGSLAKAMQKTDVTLSLEKELLCRVERECETDMAGRNLCFLSLRCLLAKGAQWLGGDAFEKAWQTSNDPTTMMWIAARYGVRKMDVLAAAGECIKIMRRNMMVYDDEPVYAALASLLEFVSGAAPIDKLRGQLEAAMVCANAEKERDITERERAALKAIVQLCLCADDNDPLSIASQLSNVFKLALQASPKSERAAMAALYAGAIRATVPAKTVIRAAIDHAGINDIGE